MPTLGFSGHLDSDAVGDGLLTFSKVRITCHCLLKSTSCIKS